MDRQALAKRLRELAAAQIYIGTSSWKYEGWLGQIYTPERYLTRGKHSKAKFESTCIAEYAETFPTVCGDFSFYQFPKPEFWDKLFQTSPPGLTFALKVCEEITCKRFPTHPRYGPRAGMDNPSFLDPNLLQTALLEPLTPYRNRIGPLIFEFGAFSRDAYEEPQRFFDDLNGFLASLPQGWLYSVEIRNPTFLLPEYFQTLRENRTAHVLNAWTRMPTIEAQMKIPEVFTADFTVVRALLRQGRTYERAVETFQPYTHVQDPVPETRQAIADLLEISKRRGAPMYAYVNNRIEGNAPLTIAAIVDQSAEP